MASQQEKLLLAAALLASQQEEEEEEPATEYEEEYESEIESGIVRFFETITIIGLVMMALFMFASLLIALSKGL